MDRRVLDGGITVLVPERLEAVGFVVAFTERSGGVSDEPFLSDELERRLRQHTWRRSFWYGGK